MHWQLRFHEIVTFYNILVLIELKKLKQSWSTFRNIKPTMFDINRKDYFPLGKPKNLIKWIDFKPWIIDISFLRLCKNAVKNIILRVYHFLINIYNNNVI